MFINLTIQEIRPISSVGHGNAWYSIRDESGDLSFEEICGIYKQTSSKERLYLQDFGKDENLIIYIHQGTLRVNLKKNRLFRSFWLSKFPKFGDFTKFVVSYL